MVAVLGDALPDRYGRRKMIILAGIFFTISAIGTAFAPSVAWLIAGRLVSWIFFYKLVPETKGKSLEQIEERWRP